VAVMFMPEMLLELVDMFANEGIALCMGDPPGQEHYRGSAGYQLHARYSIGIHISCATVICSCWLTP